MTPDDRALVDRFCDMLAAEVGASRNTLLAYRRDLEATAEAVGSLEKAGTGELAKLGEAWASLAPSTVARRSAAVRRFYGFLLDEGLRPDDPSSALPRPTLRRPLPKILDTGEVEAMFAAMGERAASGEPLALRNLALLELLYGSGLRATELVSLPRRAVRPNQPFLMLRGKGDKERLVPVSSRAAEAVRALASARARGQPVAVSKRQVPFEPGPAVPAGPRNGSVGRNCSRSGQSARTSSRLRDSFAGRWR